MFGQKERDGGRKKEKKRREERGGKKNQMWNRSWVLFCYLYHPVLMKVNSLII